MSELPKTYDPKSVEDKLYKFWVDSGFFHAEVNPDKKPYTIVIPPPNVTGQLHMGHAFDETLQDILIRTKRMQGYEALWMPGTDHAGIATQIKVEENLRKEEGLTRYDLGREEFLKRVWAWKDKFGNRIISQLKKLGTSCDWDRERFTMDEGCSKAVREVFVNLYNKGLIYKGHRIINWCPHCATALSDAEVEYETQPGKLWHIRYPLADGSGELVVATTRPETFMGDTGVAVNRTTSVDRSARPASPSCPDHEPRDPRSDALSTVQPFTDHAGIATQIKVEENLRKEEGLTRYDLGREEFLKRVWAWKDKFGSRIISQLKKLGTSCDWDRERFTMDEGCSKAVREVFVNLYNKGLIYKGHRIINWCPHCATALSDAEVEYETQPGKLWHIRYPLADGSGELVVATTRPETFMGDTGVAVNPNDERYKHLIGKTCILPIMNREIPIFGDEYVDMEFGTGCVKVTPCHGISRQLWWGHRIPAFYCDDCGEMTVSKTDVCTCPKCGGTHIHQEEDVLDTWFSSALWPFSTLGWPDKTKELDYFYPTSTLVTGYDIIFFWVARMIFSGVEHMGETPFKTVYIHGLVRDAQGRKMSKSLGNGIDPLEVIDQYGADALRFTLATGNSPGNDMRFSDERVQASRNFCNKIWNASRFIQMNLTIDKDKAVELPSDLAIEDKWILSKFNTLVADVTRNIDQYELGLAAAKLNDFIWENFCDWYIEIAKTRLQTGDENVQKVLCYVLSGAMQLLHPFMPFITETIWQALPHEGPSVMVSAWPEYKEELHFAAEEAQMESLMDAVRAIRNRRAEMNVPPSKKAKVLILTEKKDTFSAGAGFFPKLAYASEIELIDAVPADAAKMASVVTGDAQIYMPMGDLIDFEAERARLGKEKSKVEADIDFVMKKLNNPKFVDKAPEKVVAAEREKAEKLREHLAKLEESIAALN